MAGAVAAAIEGLGGAERLAATAFSMAVRASSAGRSSAAKRFRAYFTATVLTEASQSVISVQAQSSPVRTVKATPMAAAVACARPISPTGRPSSHMSSISWPMKLWLNTPSAPAREW